MVLAFFFLPTAGLGVLDGFPSLVQGLRGADFVSLNSAQQWTWLGLMLQITMCVLIWCPKCYELQCVLCLGSEIILIAIVCCLSWLENATNHKGVVLVSARKCYELQCV